MNILHLNQSDISGGAAIAAYRLHQGLLTEKKDSRLLVGSAKLTDPFINPISRKPYVEKQLYRLNGRLGLNYVNLISSFDIVKHEFYQNANVLNFHNLHNGYFNYVAIPHLTKNKPAIFTLHDMWSFTGHCAYSYDCQRWQKGCGKCPYPETYPGIYRDNTYIEWRLKNWVYEHSNLTIVAPSRWITEQAKQSILSRFPIHYIPNGIDIQAYSPLDSDRCKTLLGIPQNKKVLMFLSSSLSVSRKGGHLLAEALSKLPASLKQNTLILTIGSHKSNISQVSSIPMLNLGYVESDRLKSIAYSAADLFLLPTRADNLPVTLQESMACGTPMVSFNVGGVSDLVRHGETGYLASPDSTQDFCDGIVKLLSDSSLLNNMAQKCRQIAIEEYSLEKQVQRYLELYKAILNY